MGSPPATPRLLYRSTRLLRAAFQQLHQQQQRADALCDAALQAEGERPRRPPSCRYDPRQGGESRGGGWLQGGDSRCCFAGETVVAHCCVLSVCSPFFMEQLGRELPPRGHRVVLELGGLKIGVLRKLVHFLYTAELEATHEEVQDVLAAARRLRVTELESLQLQGGRLVRLGPPRQLDRSCLRPSPQGSPPAASSGAKPSDSPGSTSVPSQERPCSPRTTHPSRSPVGRVKLRKVESRGCWEVVRERQPPATPLAVAAGSNGEMEAQPPQDAGALGQVGRRSPHRRHSRAACRNRGWVSPAPQQDCGQGVPLVDPEEEEVDVGMVELCLPPGTISVWPCPSPHESDEEVDVLD